MLRWSKGKAVLKKRVDGLLSHRLTSIKRLLVLFEFKKKKNVTFVKLASQCCQKVSI